MGLIQDAFTNQNQLSLSDNLPLTVQISSNSYSDARMPFPNFASYAFSTIRYPLLMQFDGILPLSVKS